MYISELSIINYRNFNQITVALQEGLNVIVGPNNVGKSNFIEVISFLYKDPKSFSGVDNFNKYLLCANIDKYKKEPPTIEITYTIEHDLNITEEDSAFSRLSNILVFDPLTGDIKHDEDNQKAHLVAKTCLKYEFDRKEIDTYKKEMGNIPSDFQSFFNVLVKLEKYFKWTFYNVTNDTEVDRKIINGVFEIDEISASRTVDGITDNSKKYVNEKIKEKNIDTFSIQQTITKTIQTELTEVKEEINSDINEDQNQIGIINGKNKFVSNFVFDSELSDFFKYELEDDLMGFPLPLGHNGLGYNNLIYIRNLLKQKKSNDYNIILLEEPEAHLHPNMQYKLLSYIEDLKEQNRDDTKIKNQIFVTTHSANITARLKTNNIILFSIERGQNPPVNMAINLSNNFDYEKVKGLFQGEATQEEERRELLKDAKKHLEKFLDVTRSDILFSERIILVEGIAEKLLIPRFYEDLIDDHIVIIELGGINFNYFLPLVFNSNKKVLCITDRDKEIIMQNDNELILDIQQYDTGRPRINDMFKAFPNQIKIMTQKKYGSTFEKELFIENYDNAVGFATLLTIALPDSFQKLIKHKSLCYWEENYKQLLSNHNQTEYVGTLIKSYKKLYDSSDKINKGLIEKMFFTNLFYHYVKGQKGNFALNLFNEKEKIKMPAYIEEGIQWLKA